MEGFKYKLEPYKGVQSRHTCPNCGQRRNFARYIDVNGNHLGDDVGRCNSENHCGYHKKPNNNAVVEGGFTYKEVEPTFLRPEHMSLFKYKCDLFKFLCTHYDPQLVMDVFELYEVRTTSQKWRNATVFYQKDLEGRYRTGKIILYLPNGKRKKEPYSHIYWVHNGIEDFQLEQCLFGEHLLELAGEGNIYLVESEKTALICSLENPSDTFIATGGLSNLSPKKLSVLSGYDVEAIPDKGGYDYWKEKLEPLGITVNTIMEDSDLGDGDDIADLILSLK